MKPLKHLPHMVSRGLGGALNLGPHYVERLSESVCNSFQSGTPGHLILWVNILLWSDPRLFISITNKKEHIWGYLVLTLFLYRIVVFPVLMYYIL